MRQPKISGMALIVALSLSGYAFFILSDVTQFLFRFSNDSVYFAYGYRYWISGISIVSLLLFLFFSRSGALRNTEETRNEADVFFLWNPRFVRSPVVTIVSVFIVLASLFLVYRAPETIVWPGQQHTAKYGSIDEASPFLKPDDRVGVVEENHHAIAFPHIWIIQPHVAGIQLENEEIVMTYCGLSDLGLAYRNRHDQNDIDLQVVAQLQNNAVFYDKNSGRFLQQIKNRLSSGTKLERIPVVTMPFASFQKLHPDGQVFINPPDSATETLIQEFVVNRGLYGKGGQFDPATPDLLFPTISYDDRRVPAKEKVYGIHETESTIAITKGYLIRHDNVATESVNGQTVTIKYFPEFDLVDAFYGNHPGASARAVDRDGTRLRRYPLFSEVLWIIWSRFYPATEVRS